MAPNGSAGAAGLPFLPYGRQTIDEADIRAVVGVLTGDWLTCGPMVERFETAFAARVGARYAVACSSGTAGLHLAAMALNLGAGDAVIVPAITFLATANAARFVGAEVIFADVDPDTGLLGIAGVQEALKRAGARNLTVRAIFPVHLNGQSCPELPAIRRLAEESGMAVVEDACHAVGTEALSGAGSLQRVGGCADSDLAVFSFHPVKTIAMGEGGAVTTASRALRERMATLRTHGMVRDPSAWESRETAFDPEGRPNPWYYEMGEVGFNYRASDLHCALGLSQLGKLDGFVAARARLVARYDRLLAPFAPRLKPLGRVPGCRPAWHLYVALIDFAGIGVSRGAFMERLRERGVGSQVHYMPLYQHPYYRRRYGGDPLPGAEAYYARCLSLPLYPALTDADQERVVEAVGAAL